MPTQSARTQRAIVWAVVALFGITIAAVVIMAVFVADASAYIPAVLAAVTPTIAVLVTLREVAGVKADTHALTNGLLDSKVRAGVAEVLPDELVDPDYHSGRRAADQASVDDRHNSE